MGDKPDLLGQGRRRVLGRGGRSIGHAGRGDTVLRRPGSRADGRARPISLLSDGVSTRQDLLRPSLAGHAWGSLSFSLIHLRADRSPTVARRALAQVTDSGELR